MGLASPRLCFFRLLLTARSQFLKASSTSKALSREEPELRTGRQVSFARALFLFSNIYFSLVCMTVLLACMYVLYRVHAGARRGQKKVLDPLKL